MRRIRHNRDGNRAINLQRLGNNLPMRRGEVRSMEDPLNRKERAGSSKY
jgi:hypothetical protein